MASVQYSGLQKALDLFWGELSDSQRSQINGTNQKSIRDAIQEMQGRLGREKILCKLTRIEKFLSAMDHIEKLVTIFLNVHEVVAFVWGPIKLALMAATTWTDSVRGLIDAYEEIAEVLGNLAFFHNIIQGKEHLRLIVEAYFSDILCFHRCVLDVFSRPNWKRLFKWTWGSFKRQIKPIIESLRRRQEYLSDDKLQLHSILQGVQDSDIHARSQFRQLEAGLDNIRTTLADEQLIAKTSQDREMRAFLERKLHVSNLTTDYLLDSPELSIETSGHWIFSNSEFRFWEARDTQQNKVLFLNGCPGAGKSTLAKTVIRYLNQERAKGPQKAGNLAYFFFKHNDTNQKSLRSMLCHIITQLIYADETLMRYVYDRCSSMDILEPSFLKQLSKDCLTSQSHTILVLDGLDEAPGNVPEESIKWCLDELLSVTSSGGCHIKLLICGQEDGRIDPLLLSHPQVRLHTVDSHQRDIYEYCKHRAAEIRYRFCLTEEDENNLISKVAGASQGMFMYAEIVLANFERMDSLKEVKNEMKSDKFPKSLDQAYERIVQRVLYDTEESRQNSVKKILGSLVEVMDCDLFGSTKSEQTVNIVHQTASTYLIQSKVIDLAQEHMDMALFCCRYLSSQPFLIDKECPDIYHAIQTGYFGFMDYAAVHFTSHRQAILSLYRKLYSASESKIAVDAAISDLVRSYCDEVSDALVEPPCTDHHLKTSHQDLGLSIEKRVAFIRETIHTQQNDLFLDAQFTNLEGPVRFKCPRIQCSKFAIGFVRQDAYDEHLEAHDRPFRCNDPDCFAYVIGYASQKQLKDHYENFHSESSQSKFSFPNVKGAGGWDVVEACKAGNLDEVKRFHQAGVDLSKAIPKKTKPLSAAVIAGRSQICEYLVSNGVDPYRQAHRVSIGSSPASLSIRHRKLQILELFLRRNCDATYLPRLIAVAISADFSCGLDLLMTFIQPEEHFKTVSEVLSALSAYNSSRDRVIGQAQQKHSFDATTIHAWLERVFPKLYHDTNALTDVCGINLRHDLKEYQTAKEAILKNEGLRQQILKGACHPLKMFMIDFVNKDDLQVKDKLGATPLHLLLEGARREHFDTTKPCQICVALVQRMVQIDDGLSANIPDDTGKLPAHRAMEFRVAPGALETLLPFMKDLNHKDNNGESLLHHTRSSTDRFRVLLKHDRIDPFIRNSKGQTAFSAKIGSCDRYTLGILECLVQADKRLAWIADENRDGRTPLHYAMENLENENSLGFKEIMENYTETASFLLQLPCVENILRAYLACPSSNNPQKVRRFAKDQGLDEALEVMDRIGF
ncbi:hypothetical protein HG530_000437 [Fusarium avenaceum]|nr:hypothetical protein HG530_000437 [Fusarium avenaceum]